MLLPPLELALPLSLALLLSLLVLTLVLMLVLPLVVSVVVVRLPQVLLLVSSMGHHHRHEPCRGSLFYPSPLLVAPAFVCSPLPSPHLACRYLPRFVCFPR